MKALFLEADLVEHAQFFSYFQLFQKTARLPGAEIVGDIVIDQVHALGPVQKPEEVVVENGFLLSEGGQVLFGLDVNRDERIA